MTSRPRPGKIGRRYVATSQASILSLWKCYERTRLQLFADPCNFLQILSASPVLTAIVRPRALCRARRPIIHQIEAKTNHHTTYFRGVTMEIVGIITYPVDMEAAATHNQSCSSYYSCRRRHRPLVRHSREMWPTSPRGRPLRPSPTSRDPLQPVHLKVNG